MLGIGINVGITGSFAGPSGPPAPVNTVAPEISTDQPIIDNNWNIISDGTWDGSYTFTYQWQNNPDGTWTDIVGATANTYQVQAGDYQLRLRVIVTASNGVNSTPAESNQSGLVIQFPTNTAQPTLDNTSPHQNDTITVNVGGWLGPIDSFIYQWFWEDSAFTQSNIAGANSNSINLDSDTVQAIAIVAEGGDFQIACQVEGQNAAGTSNEADTDLSNPVEYLPFQTEGTSIQGTVQTNQMVTAGEGTWFGNPVPVTYSYQWQHSPTDDPSFYVNFGSDDTGSTFTIPFGFGNEYLRVVVTGSNALGEGETSPSGGYLIATDNFQYGPISGSMTFSLGNTVAIPNVLCQMIGAGARGGIGLGDDGGGGGSYADITTLTLLPTGLDIIIDNGEGNICEAADTNGTHVRATNASGAAGGSSAGNIGDNVADGGNGGAGNGINFGGGGGGAAWQFVPGGAGQSFNGTTPAPGGTATSPAGAGGAGGTTLGSGDTGSNYGGGGGGQGLADYGLGAGAACYISFTG